MFYYSSRLTIIPERTKTFLLHYLLYIISKLSSSWYCFSIHRSPSNSQLQSDVIYIVFILFRISFNGEVSSLLSFRASYIFFRVPRIDVESFVEEWDFIENTDLFVSDKGIIVSGACIISIFSGIFAYTNCAPVSTNDLRVSIGGIFLSASDILVYINQTVLRVV